MPIDRDELAEIYEPQVSSESNTRYQPDPRNDRQDSGDNPKAPQNEPPPIRASRFIWRDPKLIPRRSWLYPGLYIREFVSITIAAGGTGKTGECLAEAVALVTGRDLLRIGPRFAQGAQNRVWYWNGEDPLVEMERQVHAIFQHYEFDEADRKGLAERLFLDSGRNNPIDLVHEGKSGIVVDEGAKRQIIETITAEKIDLAIFDPLANLMSAAGNSNEAMNLLVRTCGEIGTACDCAVGLVHHPRKTNGGEISTEDARGGSALIAGARVGRVLNRMTAEEGHKAGIKGNAYRRYFRMSSDKLNLTPPEDDTTWRYLDSATLPNADPDDPLSRGDNVRVVTRWVWPSAFEGVEHEHIIAFQNALENEARLVRLDPQSGDWVGYLLARILGWSAHTHSRRREEIPPAVLAARARLKIIIKTWVENGLLVVEDIKDEKRDRIVQSVRNGTRYASM